MDEKLRKILLDFCMELHKYEEKGGDLPEMIDNVWEVITYQLGKE